MNILKLLPKVSVCVITYNHENYIRKCLQSIVDQITEFDFEVIIGEDCSTDGTKAIVEEFTNKYPHIIIPIFQKKNIDSGVKNLLDVYAKATGLYIAHIDGDDYMLPGKLQAQAALLDDNMHCVAVWHRVDYFDDLGGFCDGATAEVEVFKNRQIHFETRNQVQ